MSRDYTYDLERSILGITLLDPQLLPRAEKLLAAEDFVHERHGQLFRVMVEMRTRGQHISPVSVGLEMKRQGLLDEGDEQYLAGLVADPSSADPRALEERCGRIKDESLRRTAEAELKSAASKVRDRSVPLIDTLTAVRQATAEIETGDATDDLPPISTAVDELMAELETGFDPGVPTGIPPLDEAIQGGMKPGQLITLAGSTGSGKTSLAMQIGMLVAQWAMNDRANRGPALVYSFEMSSKELAVKLVLQVEPLLDGYKGKGFSRRDQERVRGALARIRNLPLHIDSRVEATVPAIRGSVERYILQYGRPSVVIIDHIHLMSHPGVRAGQDTQMISEITKNLKRMAAQLGIPILALAQLNREQGKRDDHRPQLTDLRASGSIEQDSNIVLLTYRPSYFWKDLDERALEEMKGAEAFVYVAKNRSGPTSTVKLEWVGPRTAFRVPADTMARLGMANDYGVMTNIEQAVADLEHAGVLDEVPDMPEMPPLDAPHAGRDEQASEAPRVEEGALFS